MKIIQFEVTHKHYIKKIHPAHKMEFMKWYGTYSTKILVSYLINNYCSYTTKNWYVGYA